MSMHGRLVQCGWDKVSWYIHPKGETEWLCVGLAVKSLTGPTRQSSHSGGLRHGSGEIMEEICAVLDLLIEKLVYFERILNH